MALDRRVATDDATDHLEVGPSDTDVQAEGGSAQHARRGSRERLGQVPTQRGPAVGTAPLPQPALAPAIESLPDERTPEPVAAPERGSERRPGRVALFAVAVTATLALVVTAGVVQHQSDVRLAERRAEEARLAASVATIAADEQATDLVTRDDRATASRALAHQRAAASGGVATAAQALAASPHASAETLAALQAAIDAVAATAADPLVTGADLAAAQDSLAAPLAAAQQAEAAWQAAEAARIAAEEAARKAAEEAAAKQAADAAAAAARAAKPRSSSSTGTRSVQAPASSPSSAPGSAPSIPAGGLVCPGAPTGGGAGESSVDAIGAGINAYRQSQGLPALAVGRSGGLVSHAIDMATAGGIWHSGSDNIVGCTSGSVQSLINAWAASAPHNAQMLRTDVSSMAVGGASLGGWLYGAVKFN